MRLVDAFLISTESDRDPNSACALNQQLAVGKTNELTGQVGLRERKAQLRPDTCRLTRGQGDTRGYDLYST